jgi:hypothetical protein
MAILGVLCVKRGIMKLRHCLIRREMFSGKIKGLYIYIYIYIKQIETNWLSLVQC